MSANPESLSLSDADVPEAFVTYGDGKWGGNGFGQTGGIVTWSIMPGGLYTSLGGSGSVGMSSFLGFDYGAQLQRAFDAWSSAANIRFVQVADPGVRADTPNAADIRIAGEYIDGKGTFAGNTLAHVWPPHSTYGWAAYVGTMAFDSGDVWDSQTFYRVALHEIGHAIGMDHSNTKQAIMYFQDNPNLSGLQPDDVAGAVSIYGAPGGSIGNGYHMPYNASDATMTLLVALEGGLYYGNVGDNVIVGTSASEIIYGWGGRDVLYGGGGSDRLVGDKDVDYGADSPSNATSGAFEMNSGEVPVAEGSPSAGDNDVLKGGDGGDYLFSRGGPDWLEGGNDGDSIDGGSGDDVIFGDAGGDYLFGDGGNDNIKGGDDGDYMLGGNNEDWLEGGNGADMLYGQVGNDVLIGETGGDYLIGDDGNDVLKGGHDGDYHLGGNGGDYFEGGAGGDMMYGGAGDDVVLGGADNDVITGESGNDQLYGGAGEDKLYGGSGVDQFVYQVGLDLQGVDTIVDFQAGASGDYINLDTLLGNAGYGGNDPVTAGYLTWGHVIRPEGAQDTWVVFDVDGGANGFQLLIVLKDVNASELSLANNFLV